VIRNLEANAAAAYFSEWRDLPVAWPKADVQRIPEHWRFVGSRQSPLTGCPRLVVTPVHAILNYCFALLECETRLAISALGLDAGLGMGLHTDTANRDFLAFDVLEPVRPHVEAWMLDWIAREPFCRADFFEAPTGNCRLMSPMCSRLSYTTSAWGKLIAPWAEYVARTLRAEAKSGRTHNSVPPTRLTQQRRIEAKGKVWTAAIEQPKADHLCRGCGKTIAVRRTHCSYCSIDSATTRMADVARLGRLTANSPQANDKRAHIARQNATAQHSWVASSQPRWLTDQLYCQKIQPLFANISTSVIASSIGVSRCYAGNIRKGRFRPHPRHWLALAQLAGIAPGS
jgi:CRISPR associated protein Cas1